MRLIVAGSRDFNNYSLLRDRLNYFLKNVKEPIEIVSGAARGADKLGERYAKENGYSVKLFPADWDKYGRGAGFIRNKQMAEYATHCICFWDGKSQGTKLMIDLCKTYGLKYRIVKF